MWIFVIIASVVIVLEASAAVIKGFNENWGLFEFPDIINRVIRLALEDKR